MQKLKWDEEADLEDMDDDDKAEFETLRKVGSCQFRLAASET